MRVLVFSDSHGNTNLMHEIIGKETFDMILHLGDCYNDMLELRMSYDVPVYGVVGNVDHNDEKSQMSIDIMGHNVFMCHGHRYRVKNSLQSLKSHTKNLHFNIVLFGHTHEPYLDQNNQIMMNPGSISKPLGDSTPTYGVLEFTKTNVQSKIIYVK